MAFSLFLPGSFAIPRADPQPVDMDDAVVEFDLGAVVALEPVDIGDPFHFFIISPPHPT